MTGVSGWRKSREGRGEALRKAVDGRVVLITGASSGIGAATARKVADAGAIVLLVARSVDRLEDVRAEIAARGGIAHVYPTDLSDSENAVKLAREVLAQHGHIDVVVSNAGRSIRRTVANSSDRFHDFQRTMDVNYFGAIQLLLELLPHMRERGYGHIVNVSSILVQLPVPRYAAYSSSKAAFDYWLRSAAPEIRRDGVLCTSLYFGLVRTRMSAPTKFYRFMPGRTAEQAADWIGDSLIKKTRTRSPAYGRIFELAGSVARSPLERLFSAAYGIGSALEHRASGGRVKQGYWEWVRPRAIALSSHSLFPRVAPRILPRIDRAVFRLSHGRILTGQWLMPSLMLTTTGSRSGLPRQTPLSCFPFNDDSLLVVDSNYGRPQRPAWSNNLLANLQATVVHRSEEFEVTARLLNENERKLAWPEIFAIWPTYRQYVERCGRDVRVFQLVRHQL
jgi:deazaflavin-dependent oxidoreductase (nitroreductase family)